MTLEARAVPSVEPDPPPPHVADPRPTLPPPEPPPPPPPHSLAPRRPRTLGGVVFLLVLAGTVAGVAVVVLSDWQAGLTLSGGSLLGAAFARLVLPNAQAGMLGVRRKLVDVATLLVLGTGLVTLAALIPPRTPL